MSYLRPAVAKITEICVLCDTEPQAVSHFILKCPQLSYLRDKFYDNVFFHSPDLKDQNEMTQLKHILDLQCPPDTIRYCCQYIRDIYCFRGNVISNVVNTQMLEKKLMY